MAKVLWPPQAGIDGTGADRLTSGTSACPVPMIMFGNGTPAGTIAPWTTAAKGSIWISRDQSDNAICVWVKQAANDAVADWIPFRGTGQVQRYETQVFDMDAGANEYDYLYFPNGCEIIKAYQVWTEACDASGAADGNVSAGSAADGTQYIGAHSYTPSSAVGTARELTVTEGTVASKIVTKNTKVAATEAGKFKVVYYVVQP
jgi:hypothetical protein